MLKVILGCSICGCREEKNIALPFDCYDVTCPHCDEDGCLYIVRVLEDKRAREVSISPRLLAKLYRIREIEA